LAHVHEARQAQQRAVVVVADAVLAAAEGEDKGIRRGGLGVVGEVIAARFGAVAAADDEEAADLAGLDGVHDGAGGIEQHGAVEADGGGLFVVFGQRGAGLGFRDHFAEVIGLEALAAGDGGGAGGVEAVGVGEFGDEDAIGGGDDGAGEAFEFAFLVLPGAAVVAAEVGVLAELGIHVAGQHFAVGVDLDVGAFALFEQVVEVDQIVAGDEDARAGVGAFEDLGGGGFAKGGEMAGIEHFHDAEILLAEFHGHFQQRWNVEIDIGHGGEEGFFDEGGDLFVVLTEAAGVVGVGGHAFEAVEDDFLEGLDVLVFAADADGAGAAGAVGGLFALITQHETTPDC